MHVHFPKQQGSWPGPKRNAELSQELEGRGVGVTFQDMNL